MNKSSILWITLLVVGFLAIPASAGILDFNLGSCAQVVQTCVVNTDTGHPVLDYLAGGFDLSTSGFIGATPANLFVKAGTPDESGLGLTLGPTNEIGPGESVSINLSTFAKAGIDSGELTISSLQTGEGAFVTDSTGTKLITEFDGTGLNTTGVTFTTADPIVTVTAGTGSVLAAGDLEVSVPETSTLLLFATSIVGLLLLKRKIL